MGDDSARRKHTGRFGRLGIWAKIISVSRLC
jgi:hypothetical protein